MNRRDLLKLLLGTTIAEAVDIDRLLWVPRPIIAVSAPSPLIWVASPGQAALYQLLAHDPLVDRSAILSRCLILYGINPDIALK